MFNCTCVECGVVFNARTNIARICSSVCRMRAYRRTDKGKASVLKSNKRYKRPDKKKVCIHCGKGFVTARETQELCSSCSGVKGSYYSQRRYRDKYPKKVRR